MFKLLVGVVLAAALSFAAKPVSAAPSISLIESDPHLGGVVHFNWDDGGLKGNKNPRIQVVCSDTPGHVIYGESQDAVGHAFTLGGSSSPWLNEFPGPADCVATLYYWDFHPVQTFIPLAEVSFHAEG